MTNKEAIENLLFMKHNVKEHSKQDKALDLAIKALEERPQGEWIRITRKGTVPVEYVCSCCGRKIYDNYALSIPMSEFYPFCHCGADTRKGVV